MSTKDGLAKPPTARSVPTLTDSQGAVYTDDVAANALSPHLSAVVTVDAHNHGKNAPATVSAIYSDSSYLLDDPSPTPSVQVPSNNDAGDYILDDEPDSDGEVSESAAAPGSTSVIGYAGYSDVATPSEVTSGEYNDAYAIEDQPDVDLKGDLYVTTKEEAEESKKKKDSHSVGSFSSCYIGLDIEDPGSALELPELDESDDDTEIRGRGLLRMSVGSSGRGFQKLGDDHYGSYHPSDSSETSTGTSNAYNATEDGAALIVGRSSSQISNATPAATSDTYFSAPSSARTTIDSVSDSYSSGYSVHGSSASDSSTQSAAPAYSIPPRSSTQSLSRSRPSADGSAPVTTPQAIQDVLDSNGSWNDRFQRIYDAPDSEQKYDALHRLSTDFLGAAETYGRVIIAELSLLDDDKSIKPVDIGGVAGGSKYKVRGILFKFAIDMPPHYLYGSDEYAQKAAGHELKGLNQWSLNSEGLHFPLMALVSYCGFTLVALSTLPIGQNSLVYGSDDAGRTVHFDDDSIYEKMKKTGLALNLKGHYLVADPRKLIYGPGDIEGHLGTDKLHYVLDYARVYPPAAMVQGEIKEKSRCLFRLLRPELVSHFTKPLSSDAFTAWGRINSDIHNAEVREATQFLVDQKIPLLAHNLVKENLNSVDITREFHLHGVNMRYLGLVRRVVSTIQEDKRQDVWLLREMVVRVIKTVLFQKWRELIKRYQRITPDRCIQEAVSVLNAAIEPQATAGSQQLWRVQIRKLLSVKFPLALFEEEEKVDTDSGKPQVDLQAIVFGSSHEGWNFFFNRISRLTGIRFGIQILHETAKFPSFGTLTSGDIVEIHSSVKQMSLVDFAFVMSKALNALRQLSTNLATRLFSLAIERLRRSPEISLLVLRRVIALKPHIIRTLKRMKFSPTLVNLVGELIDVALSGSLVMCRSLPTELAIDAAVFLHEIHSRSDSTNQKVITYLKGAIAADPTNPRAYLEAAKITAPGGFSILSEEARAYIDKAAELGADNAVIRVQLGALLMLSQRLFQKDYEGYNGMSTMEEVLSHWQYVKEKEPEIFRALDLHHFVHVSSNSSLKHPDHEMVQRSRCFSVLINVAKTLNCPQLNDTIKEALRNDFTTLYFLTADNHPWTREVFDFLVTMGPFPNWTTLVVWEMARLTEKELEEPFTRLLAQCPNLSTLRISSAVPFIGSFLQAVNTQHLTLLDVSGTMVDDEHLETWTEGLVAKTTVQPVLMGLFAPPTVSAACMGRILTNLSKILTLQILRISTFDEALPDAVALHAATLTFLSLNGMQNVTIAQVDSLATKLTSLLILDCTASSLQENAVAVYASRNPIHPTLEILVSSQGIHYFHTGATAKHVVIHKQSQLKPMMTAFLPEDDWLSTFRLLCHIGAPPQAVAFAGSTLSTGVTVVALEKNMHGHSMLNVNAFGMRKLNDLRLLQGGGHGNQINFKWTIFGQQAVDVQVPAISIQAIMASYIMNEKMAPMSIRNGFGPYLSCFFKLPYKQAESCVSIMAQGGMSTVTFERGTSLNYVCLAVLTYLCGKA